VNITLSTIEGWRIALPLGNSLYAPGDALFEYFKDLWIALSGNNNLNYLTSLC